VLGRRGSLIWAVGAGAAMFALCFLLLTLLMAYVRRRQEQESQALEDD